MKGLVSTIDDQPHIVFVANLKLAKLMGVESSGMLLATDTEEGLTPLGFDRPPKTGAKIH
ncbi:MAG: hypothetical protein V1766_07640 [Pseudomonadota bacterium]